ncbi:hypothetical protein B0T26DRAFT_644373 [Lasiosphaeria miniovina]|uniref:Uncharacterized protein n=1 Tax=Lasiosphaeria miniovina TaxID=1954250 RepID=A0AA40DYW0_9PEZI|nr:uncharacterized protein B0T26DRAFT_644373 [Lasiosphaeria miniovina]KAK0721579.1 hypothetical protein B0T26DRAFT_644373 [Lasiosphaeria miniovina]
MLRPPQTYQLYFLERDTLAQDPIRADFPRQPILQPPGHAQPVSSRKRFKCSTSKIWGVLREGSREAWQDLKVTKWHRAGWVFFLVWVGFLFGTLVFSTPQNDLLLLGLSTAPCQPDGSLSPFMDTYKWWSADQVFQVTIGFGSLTFAQAKVVDIVWDIARPANSFSTNKAVGRLGQAIMAYFSWKVFADYVTTSMAASPTTYSTYWIIYLCQEPSVASCLRLMRDFWRRRVLKSKPAMAFILLEIAYLLSFPTLVGAMTGYTTANQSFVTGVDSSLIPFSDFSEIQFIIYDGSRIGLLDNYMVTYFRRKGKPSVTL